MLYADHHGDPLGIVAPNGARTSGDIDDFGRTVRHSSPDTGIDTVPLR